MSKSLANVNVDIILPNYNSEKYLKETINSVINQSFKNWKLTIVDANSNLKTKKILLDFKKNKKISIIYLKKNRKAGFCRNLAIKKTRLDYIAFIDSDDIWHKKKLSEQLYFMIKNKYNFTYTNYLPFKDDIKKKNLNEIEPLKKFSYYTFTKNTSIATSSMIVKRSLVGNTKFTNTKICEDYFFKCKILKKTKYAYCLTKNLMSYRIRKNSLQSNKMRNIYWIWHINKKYNRMNLLSNIVSIFFISFNSIKKYGFK